MNDTNLLIINLTFVIIGFIQVHKIYKVKETRSHSYIWHGLTFIGLSWLSIEYLNSPYFLSFVSCSLNAFVRLIILIQMLWYNSNLGNSISYWLYNLKREREDEI